MGSLFLQYSRAFTNSPITGWEMCCRWLLRVSLWLIVALLSSYIGLAQTCGPVKPGAIQKARDYISKKLGRDISKIEIKIGAPAPQLLCFLPLAIKDLETHQTFNLFLSQDGRILTSELYDLASDPVAEQRRQDEEIASALRNRATAVLGPAGSPVEVVVFLDFECPFCRQIDSALEHLLSDGHPNVRIIYRAFPLPSHPWSLEAAAMAACVQAQNKDAFWRLVGNLFQNQPTLTLQTLPVKVDSWLRDDKSIDETKFKACLENGQGKRLVDRDLALGKKVGVTVTPTSFINGMRFEGATDETTLKNLVLKAEHQDKLSSYQLRK